MSKYQTGEKSIKVETRAIESYLEKGSGREKEFTNGDGREEELRMRRKKWER